MIVSHAHRLAALLAASAVVFSATSCARRDAAATPSQAAHHGLSLADVVTRHDAREKPLCLQVAVPADRLTGDAAAAKLAGFLAPRPVTAADFADSPFGAPAGLRTLYALAPAKQWPAAQGSGVLDHFHAVRIGGRAYSDDPSLHTTSMQFCYGVDVATTVSEQHDLGKGGQSVLGVIAPASMIARVHVEPQLLAWATPAVLGKLPAAERPHPRDEYIIFQRPVGTLGWRWGEESDQETFDRAADSTESSDGK